jgi:predicted helicase
LYRPFVAKFLYYDKVIVHRTYQQTNIFPIKTIPENLVIGFSVGKRSNSFSCLVSQYIPSLDMFLPDANNCLPLYQYDKDGIRHDNITDWGLKQFREHYPTAQIEKRDIFNYVYAVLHDPRYRQKFILNLKVEFPRIPFHPDFQSWAAIGAKLIALHADFEHAEPYELKRVDIATKTAPICRLKANKTEHYLEIDSATRLENIPEQAWDYQLGNRCALEWVLDQYKEKTPKDPTIREKFNTYHFADYKEQVIGLLEKVCRVSVETMELIAEIEALPAV